LVVQIFGTNKGSLKMLIRLIIWVAKIQSSIAQFVLRVSLALGSSVFLFMFWRSVFQGHVFLAAVYLVFMFISFFLLLIVGTEDED
jgi:hypothetical protein